MKLKVFISNGLATFIASPIRLLLNIYLASLLLPADYGSMVIPMIVVVMSDVFLDAGLRQSVIQKSSLNNIDSSTVYFTNLAIAVALFLLIMGVASFLLFKGIEAKTAGLLQAISFVLLIKATYYIPEARLQIKGRYALLVGLELVGYLIGYVAAIFLAKNNAGPYSLVALYLIAPAIYSLFLACTDRFSPKINDFSFSRLIEHWCYGKFLLSQGLLEMVSAKADEIFVATISDVRSLGFYIKGKDYASVFGIAGSKFFSRPWFSEASKHAQNISFLSSVYVAAYCFLALIGVIFISFTDLYGANFLVEFMGPDWVGFESMLRLFSVAVALYYLVTFNKYTIAALGDTKLGFKVELFSLIIRFILFALIAYLFDDADSIIKSFVVAEILLRALILLIHAAIFWKRFGFSGSGVLMCIVVILVTLLTVMPLVIDLDTVLRFNYQLVAMSVILYFFLLSTLRLVRNP